MRVGIYNRWLPTLGGGERYTLDFARVLAAAGHQVELLTHQPLDLAVVNQRLALDLDRITARRVPDSPANQQLSAVSAEYDLLLNLSHGDIFRSQARKSIMVVHFPQPLAAYSSGGEPTDGFVGRISPSRVYWMEGVYPPETDGKHHWIWTGRRARIELMRRWRRPAQTVVIRLARLRPASVPPPRVRALINGIVVDERMDDWSIWRLLLPRAAVRGQTFQVALEVEPWTLRDAGIAPDDRERGVPLQSVAIAGNVLEERLTPSGWSKLQTIGWGVVEVLRAIDSYDVLVANSRFTQHWIKARWERDSRVVYPAVDTQSIVVDHDSKRQHILSVGRFFAGGHNKQHLAMIEAFRSLCDAGLQGWQYHLVGGCDLEQPEQRAYLERVQQAAVGYPITLHVNAPLAELQQQYREASIFWHAAGLGVDETREPDRAEHFGITTIEAQAAGCVPVVLAKGGLVETVEEGKSGVLWRTIDELREQTKRLMDNPELRARLASGALEHSRAFGFERFAHDVESLVESL